MFPNMLACFIGAGSQLIAMFFTVIVAILVAFANTEWRTSIYTVIMVILAIYGFLNGYITSRTLKFFGTTDWNFSAVISSMVLPVFITGAFFLEMCFAYMVNNAARHNFGTVLLRTVGWYLLNSTMCYYGSFRGYVQKKTPLPVAIGKVIRPIPDQPFFMNILIIGPVFGFIQFASMYAEFSYLFDSIFKSHMYSMFGFLMINLTLQIAIISLLSILQTYM